MYSELISVRRNSPPSPINTKSRHRITSPAAMALAANMTEFRLRVMLAINKTHIPLFKKMVQNIYSLLTGIARLVAGLIAIPLDSTSKTEKNIYY